MKTKRFWLALYAGILASLIAPAAFFAHCILSEDPVWNQIGVISTWVLAVCGLNVLLSIGVAFGISTFKIINEKVKP